MQKHRTMKNVTGLAIRTKAFRDYASYHRFLWRFHLLKKIYISSASAFIESYHGSIAPTSILKQEHGFYLNLLITLYSDLRIRVDVVNRKW